MIERRIPAARALAGTTIGTFHVARDLMRAVEPDRRPNSIALLDHMARGDEIARLWRVAGGRSVHADDRVMVIRSTNRGRVRSVESRSAQRKQKDDRACRGSKVDHLLDLRVRLSGYAWRDGWRLGNRAVRRFSRCDRGP